MVKKLNCLYKIGWKTKLSWWLHLHYCLDAFYTHSLLLAVSGFVLFCTCEIFFFKKIEKFKTDLMTSFILLLRILIKNGFYNFYKCIRTKYYLQNEHSQDFINAPTFFTKLLWTPPGHPKFEAFLSQIENPKKCLKTEKMLLRKRIEGYVLLFRTKIITC